MITSPEERALYAEWSKTWDAYKKGTQEVMALSRRDAGKFARDAHELNTKTVNKIGLQADEILKKDIDLNNTGADKAAADADANYSFAFAMLAAILGVAVVVGIGVGIYLIPAVSSGIASIVNPIQAPGNVHLTPQRPP